MAIQALLVILAVLLVLLFLGVPIFACINSLVHWFTDRSLTKKGVTDDALFDPAPIPPADEKKD